MADLIPIAEDDRNSTAARSAASPPNAPETAAPITPTLPALTGPSPL